MNSGVLRLYQIMSILQIMNKDRLSFLVHMLNNLINLSYIIINQHKLLTVFRRVPYQIQANQSNFLGLKISQSINVE